MRGAKIGLTPRRMLEKASLSCGRPAVLPRHQAAASRWNSNAFNDKREGPLPKLVNWYSSKLDSSPLLTKCITSGVIAGSGDLICQGIIERRQDHPRDCWWDPVRTARFCFLGTVLIAPAIHGWYGVLNRFLPGTDLGTIGKRLLLDQFMFTPLFVPTFMTSIWTLEGSTSERQLIDRLQATLPSVLVANWSLWIPAQAVNFRFVPSKYQVLFNNMVGLVWNTYLSFASQGKDEDAVVQEPIRV